MKTLGILGGGQLGRMLALDAKRLGFKVITLDPTPNSPAGQVADEQIVAKFDDIKAALTLGERCDAITYEFENINVELVKALEKIKPVHPGSHVLAATQHRGDEKQFLRDNNIPVADFCLIKTEADIDAAIKTIGLPSVMKMCRFGYDGKGQAYIKSEEDAKNAFTKFKGQELIWEKLVPFEKEVSVVCVRNQKEELVTYPVAENIHKDSILDTSIVPANISKETEQAAQAIAKKIAERLNVVGTFAVEMFVLKNGEVMVNEIAPRPHNSGHYTIDACVTSQFENQLRAVCGLPLGSSRLLKPAVMINILGEKEGAQLCGTEELLKTDNVYFHWYGKEESKPKRKMGHFTVLANTTEEALKLAVSLREKLFWQA